MFNWLTPLTSILVPQTLPFSPDLVGKAGRQASPKPLLHTFLHAPPPVLLELVNAFADDLFTLSRYGLVGERLGRRAGKFSDWCWFASTLVGLVELRVERNLVQQLKQEAETRVYADSLSGPGSGGSRSTLHARAEEELERLRKQDYWLSVSRNKLLMDLVFVSYEVFKIQRGRDPVKTFTGFASAVLSSAKLYDRHKNMLARSHNPA